MRGNRHGLERYNHQQHGECAWEFFQWNWRHPKHDVVERVWNRHCLRTKDRVNVAGGPREGLQMGDTYWGECCDGERGAVRSVEIFQGREGGRILDSDCALSRVFDS